MTSPITYYMEILQTHERKRGKLPSRLYMTGETFQAMFPPLECRLDESLVPTFCGVPIKIVP